MFIFQVINVPISDDDVIKTVTSLPRTSENSGLIDVQMKRKIEYRKPYREQQIDNKQLEEALDYLIEHHKSYKDMKT